MSRGINRRRFIQASAIGLAALAGCTSGRDFMNVAALREERPFDSYTSKGIHYFRRGNPNGISAVWVPGLGEMAEDFAAAINNKNASEFDNYAISLPGFGYSVKPKIKYTTKESAKHLEEFIDEAGIGKTFLIGESRGGSVSLRYAIKNPERVHGLVLCSSYIDEEHTRLNHLPVLNIIKAPVLGDIFRALMRGFIGEKEVRKHIEEVLDKRVSASNGYVIRHMKVMKEEGGLDPFIEAALNIDLEVSKDEFYTLVGKVPVVFLYGDKDNLIIPIKENHFLMERVDGCGHMLSIEAPERIALTLSSLKKRVEDEKKWKKGERF